MPPKSKSKSKPTPTPRQQPPSKPPSTPSSHSQQPPNWPPLKPLVPPSSLSLTPILPSQIYTISHLLTSTLCRTYVSFLSNPANIPLTTTPKSHKKDMAVRVNDRFQVHDSVFAERLWVETGLREVVGRGVEEEDDGDGDGQYGQDVWGGEVMGLNPNIRIYRYSPGQFFAPHYDESVLLDFSSPSDPSPIPGRTTWTLLIYLTTCTGGETVFYPEPRPKMGKGGKKESRAAPEPIAVGLEVGMGLLHRHGDECLLHEGREVKDGEKWVIRSDLVVRR